MKSFWIVTNNHMATLEMREIPIPEPRSGEVLVRVHAASLNRGELIVGGAVHGGPEKLGGTESSGTIEAIGDGVTGWEIGDRVMGRTRGAFAEYALMYEGQILPFPERLTWEEAAAIPSTFITAYEAIVRYGKLKADEWLLVTGASSGVGVASILTAKVLGAQTIGITGSADKLERLKSIGLNVGVNSRDAHFYNAVMEVTQGRGANLAVNISGGIAFPEILRSLAFEGRVSIVGYVDGMYESGIDLSLTHINRLQIFGISNAKLKPDQRYQTTKGFAQEILPAIVDGRISPVVDRIFDFMDLPSAKEYVETNAMVGKVVIKVQ